MLFVYKPEGATPRKWDFNPQKLMSPEVEVIERFTGLSFSHWIEAVGEGSFTAIHGLLFVLLKRQAPTLKWDEVQFCMDDIDFELEPHEKAQLRKELEAKAADKGLSPDEENTLRGLVEEGVGNDQPAGPLAEADPELTATD